MNPALELLRPPQMIKNALVAAPLFFTPERLGVESLARVAAGVACFCALSGAVYVINDQRDREADRRHPNKKYRPLAAGTVDGRTAAVLSAVALALGLAGAAALDWTFAAIGAGYVALNVAYSFGLKRVPVLDVATIAVGFVLRVLGGAALIAVVPSPWILACTGLGALFLALAKRRDDLIACAPSDSVPGAAPYDPRALDIGIVASATVLAGVYALYTLDGAVAARFGSETLYVTIPFVLAGIARYLQMIFVLGRTGGPTKLILGDAPLLAMLAAWLATFTALIHV